MSRTTQHSIDEGRFDAIEQRLAGALRPVRPPQDLLQRLRDSIHIPDRTEIAIRLRDWQRLVFVLGGVFSGAVVMITVARAMYHLAGRRHLG